MQIPEACKLPDKSPAAATHPPSFSLLCPCFHTPTARQNPEAYKLREEIARHARRLKSGEKELGERRRKAEEAGARVASLRDQLEQLQDAQVGPLLWGCAWKLSLRDQRGGGWGGGNRTCFLHACLPATARSRTLIH